MMIHMCGNANSFITDEMFTNEQIQPNAVDVKIDRVFQIQPTPFIINNSRKTHRDKIEIFPCPDTNYWKLLPATYEIVMEGTITISDSECGYIIIRSTFNRNGVFLTSGLYDSGYSGMMAGALHVTTGPMVIEKGTRVGQFVLFKSESLHKYNGSYGEVSEHDKKYMT